MAQYRTSRPLIISLAALAVSSCGGRSARVQAPPRPSLAPAGIIIAREPAPEAPRENPPNEPALPLPEDPASPIHALDVPGFDFPAENEEFRKGIVDTVLDQIGTPYRWGGASPGDGFDCSGLVVWTLAQHGVSVPRSADLQIRSGRNVRPDEIAPGDLVFYAWGSDLQKVTHVGIYVGDGDYVHSPGFGRRVQRAAAFDASLQRRFIGARRLTPPNPGFLSSSTGTPETTPTPRAGVVPSEPAKPSTITYLVQSGDYVWALARRFKVSPHRILQLNQLRRDDVLQIGQKLLIPQGEGPG